MQVSLLGVLAATANPCQVHVEMAATSMTEQRSSSSPPPYVDFSDSGAHVALGNRDLSHDITLATLSHVGGESVDGPSLHRRLSLSSESETSSVDEQLSVSSLASSIEDQLTWRGRLQRVLHSHYFHYVIIVLVVLDALIVLFELLLDIGALNNIRCEGEGLLGQADFCHYSMESRFFCPPPAILVLEGINISAPPPNVADIITEVCVCKFRKGKRICVANQPFEPVGINPALSLHYASLSILSIFMIEVGFKLFAFRLKYFTHKFEVFDGIVVVLSWVLDVASLQEESALEVAALLIILRLWRVVRIINGAVISAKARIDQQLEEARHHTKRIIHAYHKAQDKLATCEIENDNFKELLTQNGIIVPSSSSKRRGNKQPLLVDGGNNIEARLPREE